jgi:muconolactone D-isomerase
MLFQVAMTIRIPHDADQAKIKKLSAAEIELARKLQHEGKWRHIWRVAGKWANISIFDVSDTAELHEILTSLPLFAYMDVTVTPLCAHPASIGEHEHAAAGGSI